MGKRRQLEGGVMEMGRVREVLRLSEQGSSQREIHRATGIARSCIQGYLHVAQVNGVSYGIAKQLSDDELRAALHKKTPGRVHSGGEPDYEWVHRELLSRKGVTLLLLWQEWLAGREAGFSYETFCRRYRTWAQVKRVVMRQEYRPGEKMLVDYAGATLSWWDGEEREYEAQIFVAVLGASNYTYTEASSSQSLLYWLNSNARALQFFGGVPEVGIIDNLKSGVTRACRYEPEITRAYEDQGAHFGYSIMPCRRQEPRDKAKVEKAVQEVERWVLAPLRHRRFRSIAEINEAMRPLLVVLNERRMQEYRASRRELFEKLDRPALRPLPTQPFVPALWKRAVVAPDYHVQVELHWYSVPYQLVRQQLWVKITEKLVEAFHNNQRVAAHPRSSVPYRHTTVEAHMLPQHQAVKSWTAENFSTWADVVGPETKRLVATLLELPRYRELSFRSILGLQRLEKKFGTAALEKACAVANERRKPSQRFVHAVLKAQANNSAVPSQDAPVMHGNIRGADYYH